MTALKLAVLPALLLLPRSSIASPILCPQGTAAEYIAFGSAGCLDRNSVLISDFTFASGGSAPVALSSVTVTPGPQKYGPVQNVGLTLSFSPAIVFPVGARNSQTSTVDFGFKLSFPGIGPMNGTVFEDFTTNGNAPVNGTISYSIDGTAFKYPVNYTNLYGPAFRSSSITLNLDETLSTDPDFAFTFSGVTLAATTPSPETPTWLLALSGLLVMAGIPKIRRRCLTV